MTVLPAVLHPRGLTWSVLTTHRTVLRIWLVCVVLAVALLVTLRFYGAEVVEAQEACARGDLTCGRDLAEQTEAYRFFLGLVEGCLAFLPLAVAAFAGAALVGREMENGTAALAWTQSVAPVRWLLAKLTLPSLVLAGGTLSLTLLVRWVGQREFAPEWFGNNPYLATGPTGTAYVLLALLAGAVAGLLLRRTLPALALGVGVTGVAMFLGAVYRDRLWAPVFRSGAASRDVPKHAHIIEAGGVMASGERFTYDRCFETYQSSFRLSDCLQQNDADAYVLFHPASHYWPLQLVETGVLLALTAALTATAFWLLRRRLP